MRVYSSVYPESKAWFDTIISRHVPVIFFGIETTGLDPASDKIIQIAAAKCIISDHGIDLLDSFNEFVNPDHEISEFNEKFTGRPESFYRKQSDIESVMTRVSDFFGRRPVIATWSSSEFATSFLLNAGFETGHMVDPAVSIDLYKIAQSVLPKTQVYDNHRFLTVADRLDIKVKNKDKGHDARYDVNAYIEIFNRLFPLFVTGKDHLSINGVQYYEKSLYVQRLYFNTTKGRFFINGITGFMEEDTPGMFASVDMDWLSDQLIRGYHVNDLKEVVRKYYLRHHQPRQTAAC